MQIAETTVSASGDELNYLDLGTLGTGAASKAVVLDAGEDYVWPSTGRLTYGGTAITATGAEMNKLDDSLITLTTVDQSALFTVGQLFTNLNGEVYVYLEGIASVGIGSVVTYIVTTAGAATTALAINNGVGCVGVAMSAAIGGDFGWFQIAGLNLNTNCDSSAAIGQAYLGGTTGAVDDNVVVGDRIDGMQITVADSSGTCGVFMTFPSCSDTSN